MLEDPHGHIYGHDQTGTAYVYAMGEELAVQTKNPPSLRAASTWPGLALPALPALPPALVVALWSVLALLGAGLLIAFMVYSPWAAGLRAEPLAAGLSVSLAVLLVIPPLPARAGGVPTTIVTQWVLADALGSVSARVLGDGEVVAQTRHTPFGGVDLESGSMQQTFGGHRQESMTGLYYMQARWMSADTGTFISVDPLIVPGDPQGLNAYAYARNNPVSLNDPTGMTPVEPPEPPPADDVFKVKGKPPPPPPPFWTPQMAWSIENQQFLTDAGFCGDCIVFPQASPVNRDPVFFNSEKVDRLNALKEKLTAERELKIEELEELPRVTRMVMLDTMIEIVDDLFEAIEDGRNGLPVELPVVALTLERMRLTNDVERLTAIIDRINRITARETERRGQRVFPRPGGH